jgi:hypothetical protein
MPVAILVGRSLAFAVHPTAAWTRLSRRGRVAFVASYALTTYALVLTAMVLLA